MTDGGERLPAAGRRWSAAFSGPFPLLLLAFAAYSSALAAGYCFDDQFVVVRNATLQRAETLFRVFLEPWWRKPVNEFLYRPLSSLTLGLDWLVSGGAAWFPHLVNVLLHVANVALLRRLVLRRTEATGVLVALAPLLFAVHPLPSEAVFAVVGRADLLVATFSLLALSTDRTSLRSAAFLGALCSKEHGVMLLPALLVAELSFRPVRPRFVDLAARFWPLLAVLGAFTAAKVAVVGGLYNEAAINPLSNPLLGSAAGPRLAGALALVARYGAKAVWPADLSPTYYAKSFDMPNGLSAGVVAGIAILGMLAVLAWRRPASRPWLALAAVFYLPFAQVLQPIGVVFAERFAYMPLTFLLVAAAVAIPARYAGRAAVVVLALSLPLAVRTFVRGRDFESDLTLFAATVAAVPRNAMAHFNYAQSLLDAGRWDEALSHFRAAREIVPKDAAIVRTLAGLEASRGRVDEALAVLESHLRESPGDSAALAHYRSLGPPADRLLEVLRRSAAATGASVLHRAVVETAVSASRFPEALDAAERAFAGKRADGETLALGASAALRLGEDRRAGELLESAARLAPSPLPPERIVLVLGEIDPDRRRAMILDLAGKLPALRLPCLAAAWARATGRPSESARWASECAANPSEEAK